MPVRFQIASDLHLERLPTTLQALPSLRPNPDADALVLAGDIHGGEGVLKAFANWPVPVFYVLGNHEFWGFDRKHLIELLKEKARGTHIHVLENDEVLFKGVRVLGATLWTDYELDPLEPRALAMKSASLEMKEHSLVQEDGFLFTPAHALAAHQESRKWLQEKLAVEHAGPTLVITHFAPHKFSVHPKYLHYKNNAAFVSHLPELVSRSTAWVHGHCHDSFDYPVGPAQVVANPRGYVMASSAVDRERPLETQARLVFENPFFDPAYLLEI